MLEFHHGYNRLSPLHASADAIPILVDDTYHLFHLTTPPNTKHHPTRLRSSWTRLRSQDLRIWTRDAEPAITPSKDASAPDADGAWTGSAVIGPDDTMHIFYTGYNLSQAGRQVILHATSVDKHGSRFLKNPQPITITSPPAHRAAFEAIDFRDPFVFYHAPASAYWMLVATRLSDGAYWTRGCLALLTSPDLCAWSLDPSPFYAPNDLLCPECPELFSLPNGKWYLVYSRFAAPHAGTVYRVGDSARGPFRVPRDGSDGALDGRRWYAAKSCAKKDDPRARVFFGWTGDWCAEDAKWLWGGDMAPPRQVSANADGTLRVEPVPEALDALLGRSFAGAAAAASLPSSLRLAAVGTTVMRFLDLPQPYPLTPGRSPLPSYFFSFTPCLPTSLAAASFGVLLRTPSSSLSSVSPASLSGGHRLVFRPLSLPASLLANNTTTTNPILPSSPSSSYFSITLQAAVPPLDDFWADQYRLYAARGVDGPDVVRHDVVGLAAAGEPVSLLVQADVVQCFVGGRALTFRLPPLPPRERVVGSGEMGRARERCGVSQEQQQQQQQLVDGVDGDLRDEATVRELGFFVQDGEVVFEGLSIR